MSKIQTTFPLAIVAALLILWIYFVVTTLAIQERRCEYIGGEWKWGVNCVFNYKIHQDSSENQEFLVGSSQGCPLYPGFKIYSDGRCTFTPGNLQTH